MRIAPIAIGLVTGLCLCYQVNQPINSTNVPGANYDDPIRYGRDSEAKIDVANHIQKMIRSKRGDEETFTLPNLAREFNKIRNAASRTARTKADLDWKERGPGNIPGRTRFFLVDANDETGASWFVGTAGGGIWHTTNQGVQWNNASEGVLNLSVVAMAQNSTTPQTIYAGTGENGLGGITSNGSGILKSTDGGDTWDVLESTTPAQSGDFWNVNSLIIDPDDADVILAATSNGIYGQQDDLKGAVMKSVDGGATWTKVHTTESLAQQLEADPSDFDIQYLAAYSDGIYKSTDGGDTWAITSLFETAGAFNPGRTSFAIAPSNGDHIFASIGYAGRAGSGLFFSEDAGATWSLVKDKEVVGDTDYLVQGEYDNCIAVYPDDDKKVIWGGVELWSGTVEPDEVIVGRKSFLGVDESETEWFLDLVNFNNGTHYGNQLAIVNSLETPSMEIRFGSGKSQKAHRFTVPEGENAGVPDNDYAYQDYVSVPFEVWDVENNQQLMVSFRDQQRDGEFSLNTPEDQDLSNSREYIYIHSIDYSSSGPSSTIAKDGGQEESQYLFIWPKLVLDAEFNDGDIDDATYEIKFGEVEYFNMTIENMSEPNEELHPDHHFLEIFDINGSQRVASTNDGGVAISIDGGVTFGSRSKGMVTAQFYNATKKPGEDVYLGGTQDNGVLLSGSNPSESSTYSQAEVGGDGMDIIFHGTNTDQILLSLQNNIIYRSNDGGANWDSSTNGLADSGNNSAEAPFNSRFGYSRNNPNMVFAISESGIWSSGNFGGFWSLNRITGDEGWGGSLDVEVSDADPAIVWAGGAMDEDRHLFVSTDYGSTFEKTKNFKTLPDAGNITSIIPDPNDANTAYVTMSRVGEPHILRTTDLGETWEDITGFGANSESDNGFPDIATFTVLAFPDGETLWAGTELGLFESTDNGKTWHDADNGLPYVMIWDLKVVDGVVVASTHGRGIWSVDLGLEYPNQKVLSVDPDFADISVYPNPASSVLTFKLTGQNKMVEKVQLFNVNGQLVRESAFANGMKENSMRVSDLQRGMYVANMVLRDGNSLQSKVVLN